MAQKVFAQSDLDLLLTKYYKETLKSQLKNREKYTTDYILTESTELNGLRLPNDCSSNINPLPAKCFPLTPPLSPLSLTPSINLSITSSPSHNYSCLHFDPKRKVSPCHFIVTLPSVGTMEQSSKQGVKGKITSVESISPKDSLKDSSSASIPMYLRAVMPYPSSLGALFFEGSNITDFFESYNRMCIDYKVDEQEKMKRLFWYCELFTGKHIETLIGFSETSSAALRNVLREEYKDQYLNQQMNSRRFLKI